MPTVEIMVNGRRHAVQCGQGEEGRVKRLASYVDRKISDLSRGQSQLGDQRLLLMASLLVADELSDAFEEIKRLQSMLEQRVQEVETQSAASLEQVARQLDAIAARLESA
jgi:cell division protein ZapA